jgi:hypothetical protein
MKCHPDTPANIVDEFTVDIERRQDSRVWIRYHVEAPLADLDLGLPGEPERRDGLWKTTCFEAFVRKAGSDAYLEFNFAPSSAWAAYSFTGYREGMAELPVASAPELGNDASDSHFALEAIFELPSVWRDRELQMAITAVIEEIDGTKSYWSLTHSPGAPDFHHPDCFTLHLPARAEP